MSDIAARFHVTWPGFTLDVDLTVPARGVTALFGPSGSGKTTLLRCFAGLERSPSGYLRVKDEVWQDGRQWVPTHRRSIGYVFQEVSLFPHLTVMGNLRYGLRAASDQAAAHLDAAIDLLGIGHLLDRRPDQLSGGERQRVGIARALAVRPRLLLMDEPLAALDVQRKQDILPYLERLHDELDMPVLYVSHAPDEVARLADHIVVMKDGKAVAHGPLADTLARLDLPISLGEDAGVILDATIAEIDERWHLARADFDGGHLWTRHQGAAIGRRVRVRVLARDVSLTRDPPGATSVQNVFPGQVVATAPDDHPSQSLVKVAAGGSFILARVTNRAIASLNLTPGQAVWVQVKSVALMA